MKTKLVQIGNSRGIRIPKPFIEDAGLVDEVELSVEGNTLVISPARRPRQGWDAAFQRISAKGDDGLLDGDPYLPTLWEQEWEW